jgi:16S rRNA processing protein RimM
MGDDASALIQLGFVGAPFGVRGWIKLRSHTDPPERLLDHRSLRIGRDGAWQSYRIEASGRSGGALTVKLAGIEDRDQAQALRGAQVCVPRSELPQRAAQDFYRADLIGCEVVNLAGVGLGQVRHFIETPAQVLMVVRGTQEFWIPAVPQHLRRVDLQARRVVVDWSADGAGAGEGASG